MRCGLHVLLVRTQNSIPQFRRTKENVGLLLFDSGRGGASGTPFWIVKLGNLSVFWQSIELTYTTMEILSRLHRSLGNLEFYPNLVGNNVHVRQNTLPGKSASIWGSHYVFCPTEAQIEGTSFAQLWKKCPSNWGASYQLNSSIV